jgi:hypothetical protein
VSAFGNDADDAVLAGDEHEDLGGLAVVEFSEADTAIRDEGHGGIIAKAECRVPNVEWGLPRVIEMIDVPNCPSPPSLSPDYRGEGVRGLGICIFIEDDRIAAGERRWPLGRFGGRQHRKREWS